MTYSKNTLLLSAANGLSNKEIADELEVSERTIKNRFTKLYKEMGASNRTHAVAIALRKGDIE